MFKWTFGCEQWFEYVSVPSPKNGLPARPWTGKAGSFPAGFLFLLKMKMKMEKRSSQSFLIPYSHLKENSHTTGKLFLGRMPWRLFLTTWNYLSFFYMYDIPCLTSLLLSYLPLVWVTWCVPNEHSWNIVCVCCSGSQKNKCIWKIRPLDFSWLGSGTWRSKHKWKASEQLVLIKSTLPQRPWCSILWNPIQHAHGPYSLLWLCALLQPLKE